MRIVKLLCQRGADLDSVDNEGFTPLLLAILYNWCATAYYLAQCGASLFVTNRKGQTALEMAKTARKILMDRAVEPMYVVGQSLADADERVQTRNAAFEKIKESSKGFESFIDLHMALQPERAIRTHALAESKRISFSIIQTNNASWPKVSFNKAVFETTVARKAKASAFLDRGRPFEHIQAAAVSRYTEGTFGRDDGCVDRVLWTARVKKYCKVIGHNLSTTVASPCQTTTTPAMLKSS